MAVARRTGQPAKGERAAKKSVRVVKNVDEDEASSHEGEDESGISQQALQKVMQLLGDDGLDEMDLAQLEAIEGGEEEDDEEEEEEEEKEVEEEIVGDDDEEDDDDDEEDSDSDADSHSAPHGQLSAPQDSLAASILRSGLVQDEASDGASDDDEEEDDEDEEEIDVEDLPDSVYLSEETRAAKQNRVRINHVDALDRIYNDFRLDAPSSSKGALSWIETMSITYPQTLSELVPDAQNDLDRELAFYRQALDAAVRGRALVLAANVPFSRPDDYFAEMVKTDEHMERVRQRLLDESAGIKASENAKRQRELKKYGKQIQTEKLQERQKHKRDMEEKVESLKRKRGGLDLDDTQFDVQLEDAIGEKGARRDKGRPKVSRTKRDDKYGYGGKKRHQKSNTAGSTDDFGGARSKPGAKGKGGKAKRPGKARRASGRR